MNHSEDTNKQTEAAWQRMQKQLAAEPVNAQWVRWSKQMKEIATDRANNDALLPDELLHTSQAVSFQAKQANPEMLPVVEQAEEKSIQQTHWLRRNRKWLSGTAVAAVLGFTLFTSAGNEALASILNKFRMEQVTVVQENDIQQIMNNVFTDGRSQDSINKFGSFSHTSGTANGEYAVADAEKLLNYKLVVPNNWKDISKVYISPSNEITLSLHVDEVNKALDRLGAKKLLPQSIDGKPIKLIFADVASFNTPVTVNGEQRNLTFTQMTPPSIEVDPSISVEEAMAAVIQFPFLPDYLKDSLKNSGALTNGQLPLPIVANGAVEKRTIEGIEVVMTDQAYDAQSSPNSKDVVTKHYYGFTWLKNSMLYHLDGTGFTDKDKAFETVKELIQQ